MQRYTVHFDHEDEREVYRVLRQVPEIGSLSVEVDHWPGTVKVEVSWDGTVEDLRALVAGALKREAWAIDVVADRWAA